MKQLRFYLIVFFVTIVAYGFTQTDSMKMKFRNEISFGTPCLPPLYKEFGGNPYGYPGLTFDITTSYNRQYVPSFCINYKRKVRGNIKNILSVNFATFWKGFYSMLNLGREYKLGKQDRRISIWGGVNMSLGYIEFPSWTIYGGRQSFKSYQGGRIFRFGLSPGFSIHYAVSKRVFIESETSLCFSYSALRWLSYGYVYQPMGNYLSYGYEISYVDYLMVSFDKLLGLSIGYKF